MFFHWLAPPRHSQSDPDSEYGSRSKKEKKEVNTNGEELRMSGRGLKVPNYVDDVQDFGQFEDDDDAGSAYHVENAQYKEGDEIEIVLTHSRDEGRENDPEDLWFDNIVCPAISLFL
jgi:chromodomain-helicase-DNA-binding protein 1